MQNYSGKAGERSERFSELRKLYIGGGAGEAAQLQYSRSVFLPTSLKNPSLAYNVWKSSQFLLSKIISFLQSDFHFSGGFLFGFLVFLVLCGLFQFSLWLQLSLPLHLRLQGAAEE